MTDLTWHFLRSRAMSLSADDMADPLRSTHLTKAELLMRETIQNSADERLGDPPVRFTVSRLNLLGSEKRAVVQNLRLTELVPVRKLATC